jgi:hypothetical protein
VPSRSHLGIGARKSGLGHRPTIRLGERHPIPTPVSGSLRQFCFTRIILTIVLFTSYADFQKIGRVLPMSEVEAIRPAARSRSREARAAARAARGARIVELMGAGMSMADIATREGVTMNRMRKVVQAIVEKRGPQAPAAYVARETERLNEALKIAYGAMAGPDGGPDFAAVDAVVRIVRDLDRVHGFRPGAVRAVRSRPENRPEALEETKIGVGIGIPAREPADGPALEEAASVVACMRR